jgi:hypothetical protein
VFLLSGKELEKLLDRLQQYFRIYVLEVCSREEICANHLQAIPPGLVRAQHQGGCLKCLLDHRNLSLVELEVDNLVGLFAVEIAYGV